MPIKIDRLLTGNSQRALAYITAWPFYTGTEGARLDDGVERQIKLD